ncbi:MAG: sulfite exporter TauE/SafE family protein [Gammaproteobacteria bacterium]|nr:sulfite exporter TauE/SafE family protein [Gammaproteobacteria bacterium]
MGLTEILILCGGFAGGYVSGLTGFGTGLSALPFWLNAISPLLAAPLVVICSIVAQLQTLPAIWHAINWRQVFPFVLGGLLGVPAGTLLLGFVSAQLFKLFIGIFLIGYCSFMLARRVAPTVSWGGRGADGVVGFAGGILGGLAGLSGALPTVWASLRGWDKHARRGLFQVFNLTVLSFALGSQALGGFITMELGKLVLIALPGTFVGAWLGRKTYNRLGDDRFSQVVLVLLLLSGISIVVTTVL